MTSQDIGPLLRQLAESELERMRRMFPVTAAALEREITVRPVGGAFLVAGECYGTRGAAEEARKALILQRLYAARDLLRSVR